MKHLLLFLALIIGGCADFGTTPPPPKIDPLAGWTEVTSYWATRSNWLDLISIHAWPAVKPDSMLLIINADGGSRFRSGEILGGAGDILVRYYFPDGYVDRLPGNLELKVYIKTKGLP